MMIIIIVTMINDHKNHIDDNSQWGKKALSKSEILFSPCRAQSRGEKNREQKIIKPPRGGKQCPSLGKFDSPDFQPY